MLAGLGLLGCAIGPRVVDDDVVARASVLGDADLIEDVKVLHRDGLRDKGELQAGLCVQQYVRARSAEAKLAQTQDEQGRRVAQYEMLSGFSACEVQCELAVELKSKYAPIAAKYVEPCGAGSNASEQELSVEHLERLVAQLRKAVQPLGLFLAHKDAVEAIEYLRKENMADERVERLAKDVEALHDQSAEAIERGSKFFYSAPAQENFQLRAGVEAEIERVTATMNRIEAEYREASDTGRMADAQTLQLAFAAHQLQLGELNERLAQLKAQYERMAADAGVYERY